MIKTIASVMPTKLFYFLTQNHFMKVINSESFVIVRTISPYIASILSIQNEDIMPTTWFTYCTVVHAIQLHQLYSRNSFDSNNSISYDVDSTGYLHVSELHSLYYCQFGNPDGIPVLFLHGGPGKA